MLRIIEMADAEAAKSYYTGALARADYYVDGQEIGGKWFGQGAKRLGLADVPVDQKTFAALAENRHPLAPDTPLTERTRSNRRAGYDFNFHSPKSLSVLHALSGDTRIQEAFVGAVRATMAEMERSMQVRIRKGDDAEKDRITGNWVYGEFLHLTARPVGDAAPDPHLHLHCFVLNASYDSIERKWKAGQFGSIKRDGGYYEAAFHARLAQAVTALGYRIEKRGKFWELADVPRSVVDLFAKRTDLIEETAKERGITDAKAKDRLAAQTRSQKRKGLSAEDLKGAWLAQLSDAEAQSLREAQERTVSQSKLPAPRSRNTTPNAVDFAIAHVFERHSVASDRQLAEVALRHGLDRGIEVSEVWRELDGRCASKQLFARQVEDQRQCTTREAFEETNRCIQYARDGMGRCRALAPAWQIRRPELLVATADDQRAAIQHVLSSTDRVIAVQGRAGTGKTFATMEIAAALAVAGQRIQALAPTSKAVDVLRQEGFADADTISQLLINPQLQQQVAGGVLLVDEAGLLSARQMDKLFQIANTQNCRVLLQYDLSQHRAVERGSPVRDLERYAGLTAAEIHVVRRQKRADYAAAVKDLSRGEFESAFERLLDMEAFVEVQDPGERQRRLAEDYLLATRAKNATALVVSPTHREGDAVTRAIRDSLRKAGRVKKDEQEVVSLRRLGLTAAQRGEAASYTAGQIIQFTQNTDGHHQRGDRLIVLELNPNGKVLVQRIGHGTEHPAGAAFELPLDEAASFDVYETKRIALSVGDRIRITQNGYVPVLSAKDSPPPEAPESEPLPPKAKGRGKNKRPQRRLINGAMYEVARFLKNGDLVLNNGWVLPRSYGHLAHGYCTTSHASQGMTADTVLISQSAESFRASSSEQFYVSSSRGRTGIKIYTDSVDDLFRAICRSSQQTSAADLVLSTPGPTSLSDVLRSKRQRLAHAHRQRAGQTAVGISRRRSHLSMATDRGVSVIAAVDHTRLRTGAPRGVPVITTEDPTRRRTSAQHAGEWVCASLVFQLALPPDSLAKINAKAAKPITTAVLPAVRSKEKTSFVPMFHPELEANPHRPSQ